MRLSSRSNRSAVNASAARALRAATSAALAGALLLSFTAAQASAQNQKNKKEQDAAADALFPPSSLTDQQAVELNVSQMLGAWQVGNIDMMHKFFADDVVVVSAAWETPIMGWQNYARVYQRQFARTNGGRLDRTNSYTKIIGNSAWVTYQWEFNGQVDGAAVTSVGHTTLVLEKRDGNWLIVLNHTSEVPGAVTRTSSVAPAPLPADALLGPAR